MNLKALFFRAINFGIQEDQSFHDKRRIKSVNFLNLVVLVFLLIGLTNWFFIRDEFPLAIELIFIFVTILSIFLSYKNKTSLAFSIYNKCKYCFVLCLQILSGSSGVLFILFPFNCKCCSIK